MFVGIIFISWNRNSRWKIDNTISRSIFGPKFYDARVKGDESTRLHTGVYGNAVHTAIFKEKITRQKIFSYNDSFIFETGCATETA